MLLPARLGWRITALACARSVAKSTPSALRPQVHNKLFFRQGGTDRIGYRCPPPDDPIIELTLDAIGTGFWCFMFWMYYHQGGHLINSGVNHHYYDDATDAQLGIE